MLHISSRTLFFLGLCVAVDRSLRGYRLSWWPIQRWTMDHVMRALLSLSLDPQVWETLCYRTVIHFPVTRGERTMSDLTMAS